LKNTSVLSITPTNCFQNNNRIPIGDSGIQQVTAP